VSFELAEEIVLKQMIIGGIALMDNILSQLKRPFQKKLISIQLQAQLIVEIYRGKLEFQDELKLFSQMFLKFF
jgi:hypothetical protein